MFENFGMTGSMTNPIQVQNQDPMIHPLLIEKIKSLIHPAQNQNAYLMGTPMTPHEPSVMSRFGFPSNSNRPLGGIVQQGEKVGLPTTDPGNFSISEEYGLETLLDLSKMLNELRG